MKGAVESIARWAWSDARSIGFERDLRARSAPPAAPTCFEIVPLDDRLADRVFRFDGLSGRDWTLLTRRQCIWQEGFRGALVAVNSAGDPLFLQWWIPPDERDHVQHYFGALFPPMEAGRFLVEGAWVPPAHRGNGIMSEAMCRFGEAARREHPENTKAIAFVDERNRPSIRSHLRAGSVPCSIRCESWRAGVLRTEFVPLPHDPGNPFAEDSITTRQ